ncbi:hypothetical protein [Moraxella lacunata]|uniref:hypothetical protein n=1 Tax=Moraxella lacunata TaxID=477 RepID=UPI003EDE9796
MTSYLPKAVCIVPCTSVLLMSKASRPPHEKPRTTHYQSMARQLPHANHTRPLVCPVWGGGACA